MIYYQDYDKETGELKGSYDEADYRVNQEEMIKITEDLLGELQRGRCLFKVDLDRVDIDKIYETVEEIFLPVEEKFEERPYEPSELDLLKAENEDLKLRVTEAETNNLVALEALTEVYEQVLMLQMQIESV